MAEISVQRVVTPFRAPPPDAGVKTLSTGFATAPGSLHEPIPFPLEGKLEAIRSLTPQARVARAHTSHAPGVGPHTGGRPVSPPRWRSQRWGALTPSQLFGGPIMIKPIPRMSAPTPKSMPWPTPRLRPAQAAPVRRESFEPVGGRDPRGNNGVRCWGRCG